MISRMNNPFPPGSLRQDVGDDAGADGLAPLADRKAQPLVHRDRRDQLRRDRHVVPRHHHLHPPPQRHHPPPPPRPAGKMRPLPRAETHVPPPPPPPHPLPPPP